MKKRIITIGLVVALLATCITGATLSYLTDTDAKENTFTVGNVDIELLESQLHRDNDKATDERIIEDAKTYADEYLAEAGKNMVPGRWVKKAPYVYNIGKNAAYVRIRLEIPAAVWDALDIMLYTTAQNEDAITMGQVDDSDEKMTVTFTYTEALEPGKVTYYAPFWQFKISDDLDNDDLEALVGEDVVNSIYVYADAIQAEGFDTADEAFAAFDAQQAENNV